MIVMCYYFLSFISDLILFVSIIGNIRPEYGEHASWYWDLKGKYLKCDLLSREAAYRHAITIYIKYIDIQPKTSMTVVDLESLSLRTDPRKLSIAAIALGI